MSGFGFINGRERGGDGKIRRERWLRKSRSRERSDWSNRSGRGEGEQTKDTGKVKKS